MHNSWAVIFDFDGVVVNTAPLHELCWSEVARVNQLSFTHEQFLQGIGVKNDYFISEILGWSKDLVEIERLHKEKEREFQKKLPQVSLVEGLLPFLEALKNKKIPCAIASASISANIHLLLDHFMIGHYFTHIASADEVQNGKPAPDLFLLAAAKLEQIPTRCLVFEDAILGVEAAVRAKMKTVALTTFFSRQKFLESGLQIAKIIQDFTEISVEEIDQWFA
jgi:HAD superfamily hydrolase (TIGR01509 family)